MARLMDHLILSGAAQFDGLVGLPLIIADNVAHYWYADAKDDAAIWDLRKDFPNLAPPFPDFWIEFVAPKEQKVVMIFGCRFRSEKKDKHWDTEIEVYVRLGKAEPMKSDAKWYIKIGDDGKLLDVDNGRGNPVTGQKRSVINVLCMEDYYEMSQNLKVLGILPSLFAISLLHCKNVELKTQIPPAPLSKKYEKKHGFPLVRYKILEIEPMKRILRTEGQSGTLGLKHALHICRGHFKTFGSDKRLFGKYEGTYWWESHVRGNPAQGIVVKDYSINPPTDMPPNNGVPPAISSDMLNPIR
jgi:hypothetical protein